MGRFWTTDHTKRCAKEYVNWMNEQTGTNDYKLEDYYQKSKPGSHGGVLKGILFAAGVGIGAMVLFNGGCQPDEEGYRPTEIYHALVEQDSIAQQEYLR